MNIDILIRKEQDIRSRQWWYLKTKLIKSLLKRYLPIKAYKILKDSSITLLITSDKEIQNLNKTYRKINKPTDVLSFTSNSERTCMNSYHLGDIVISVKTAKKQSKEKKNTLDCELLMLLTHGYLHLLGYDHALPSEAKKMFIIQNNVLKDIFKGKFKSVYNQ